MEAFTDPMFVKTQICTDLMVGGKLPTSDLPKVSVGRCPRLPEMLQYVSVYLYIEQEVNIRLPVVCTQLFFASSSNSFHRACDVQKPTFQPLSS
jgi:hypothetical protein